MDKEAETSMTLKFKASLHRQVGSAQQCGLTRLFQIVTLDISVMGYAQAYCELRRWSCLFHLFCLLPARLFPSLYPKPLPVERPPVSSFSQGILRVSSIQQILYSNLYRCNLQGAI